MQPRLRTLTLRLDASFLAIAATAGLSSDLLGAFLALGPMAAVLEDAPHAAIGAIEAHGLALIVAVLLWRAPTSRSWHATGAAVHLLLGTANLIFWQMFVATEMLAVGYVTTALHFAFVAAQISAFHFSARPSSSRSP